MKRKHLVSDVLSSPFRLRANIPVMLFIIIKHAMRMVQQSDGIPPFASYDCYHSAFREKLVPGH
jgi:hypothetical protein